MGPLVYYCRWRGATLRLRGRDETAVWGQLVIPDEAGEQIEPFRFELQESVLWLGHEPAARLQLDELGVVVETEREAPPGLTAT